MVLTRNSLKTHFLPWSTWFDLYWPGGIGLLWKDVVDSRKIYFWILNFFLIFFWIFKNNNRNKMTFKKILVNPKLDYNSCPLFTMLTAQRHWKIHFLLTLHNKFCKEKRWKCWKIHKFFSWSNSYGRPAQMKKKHESVFNIDFVKYLKVISAMVLWNIWKWFQMSFVKYMKVISALVLFSRWSPRW